MYTITQNNNDWELGHADLAAEYPVAVDCEHGRSPAGEHPGGGRVYTEAVNRLTERYLVDTALPASVEAIRNDIERMLGKPLVAAADIAGNTLLRDWLAAGEDPAQAPVFSSTGGC